MGEFCNKFFFIVINVFAFSSAAKKEEKHFHCSV